MPVQVTVAPTGTVKLFGLYSSAQSQTSLGPGHGGAGAGAGKSGTGVAVGVGVVGAVVGMPGGATGTCVVGADIGVADAGVGVRAVVAASLVQAPRTNNIPESTLPIIAVIRILTTTP